MRHFTPETLVAALEALNPGTPITFVGSAYVGRKKQTLEEWKQSISDAGLWLTELTDFSFTGFAAVFYYQDASSITIKF